MASSGIRTPTFFLDAYLAPIVPYLMHFLGNSLLAIKMKVYWYSNVTTLASNCQPSYSIKTKLVTKHIKTISTYGDVIVHSVLNI